MEVARYMDEEWLNKPGVIRVQEGPKGNRKPVYMVEQQVREYAEKYDNVGIYVSVWQYRQGDTSLKVGPLYFDLDSDRVETAVADARQMYKYFVDTCSIPEESISVYFSGSKGLHIELEPIALGINPGSDLAGLFRFIANDVKSNLQLSTLDFAVYDERRMWRLANTRHQRTGLYKNRLPYEILFGDPNAITEYCKINRPYVIPEQVFNFKANEWYREYIYRYEASRQQPQYDTAELIRRFNKYGSSVVKTVEESVKEFDPQNLFDNCPSILKHWETAEKTHHLEHEARLFLCSLLTYSDEAIWYLNEILKNCDDYNPEISAAHINDWIKRREHGIGGRPYSCKRANAAGVGCGNCDLEPKKKWIRVGDKFIETDEETEPSPIRFAYYNKREK